MQTKKQDDHKDIVTEQHELSMLLLKLLVKISKTQGLQYEHDDPSVVSAFTKNNMRLYDIWHECDIVNKTETYWIRVQNGERRLVEFGRRANDGTFFNDDQYNYLAALYEWRQPCTNKKDNTPVFVKLAIENLKSKPARPCLANSEAWSDERIQVLKYLKELSQNKK